MKIHVASFSVFSKIFESFREQNYPEEMKKNLRDKARVKKRAKITKPKFK